MKLNYLTLVLAMLMSLFSNVVSAQDFEVGGIYYNITSSTASLTVAVTFEGTSYDSFSNEYTGIVNIPETVSYDGKTYSVTSIGNTAFHGCSGLTSIVIPNSVTSIGGGAFYNCSGLTSITIPNSVTSIGYSTFSGCTGLTSVSIGNSVTSIGTSAFYGCSSLTSINIPNSVTTIGRDAFRGCFGLTKAEFASIENLCKIRFDVEDSNPLCYAHHLYINGEEIKDLVIPNSVTNIGDYTFYNCSGLTSINIPNSVTSIGSSAFKYCKLHDVFVNCITPPSMATNAFSEQVFTHARLYVPTYCWDTYAYDAAWYKFINIRETTTAKDQVSVQKAYTLMDVNAFTYSVYDPVNDCIGTIATSNGINEDNPNHCWQIVEQGKDHYLYNIGAKKFAKRVDNNIVLTDSPVPIEMKDGDKGLIIGEQSANQWALVHNERMSVNQSPITGISPIINTESPTTTCYDLSGRKLSQMQRGINIISMKDGRTKKVLVK